MGTGYCGDNGKLGEVSYGRETWGSVSFSEHWIEGQQGERYVRNHSRHRLIPPRIARGYGVDPEAPYPRAVGRNRPMPRMVPMEQLVGSNRTMSFQRPRLVIYWCCSVLFEWCFLVLRTKQRKMGVQGTYPRPQTKFEKNNRQVISPRISRRFNQQSQTAIPTLGVFPRERQERSQGS